MVSTNDIIESFEDDNRGHVRDLLELIDQIRLRLESYGLSNDAINDDLDDLSFMIVSYY